MSETLLLELAGWCMIRQPTDPDPYDERRGVSGYTFAFGDEPDLNRVIYMQPSQASPARSHGPPHGVTVRKALKMGGPAPNELSNLVGATFDLLNDPMLENRNWALTKPGYEPITPFDIEIRSRDRSMSIRRDVPLDPAHPELPAWKLSEEALVVKGATGLAFEPETIGHATGLWDFVSIAQERRTLLQKDLDAMVANGGAGSAAESILKGRIAELTIGIDNPKDRRIGVRRVIERFGFGLTGAPASITDPNDLLQGTLDASKDAQWRIDFWMGAWDADALSCYFEGALQIPYASS